MAGVILSHTALKPRKTRACSRRGMTGRTVSTALAARHVCAFMHLCIHSFMHAFIIVVVVLLITITFVGRCTHAVHMLHTSSAHRLDTTMTKA